MFTPKTFYNLNTHLLHAVCMYVYMYECMYVQSCSYSKQ